MSKHRFAVLSVAFLSATSWLLALPVDARAAGEPALTALVVTPPTSVNTEGGPQTVSFTATMANLTDSTQVSVYLSPPTGKPAPVEGITSSLTGTAPTLTGSVTLPQWAPPGDWGIEIRVDDWAFGGGYAHTYKGTELALLGPSFVTNAATSWDSTPPVVMSATLDTQTINTTATTASVVASVTVADPGTPSAGLIPFLGPRCYLTGGGSAAPTSYEAFGSRADASQPWSCTFTFPAQGPGGSYSLSVVAKDAIGNESTYTAAQLANALGGTASDYAVTVTSSWDDEVPTVVGITMPRTFDTSAGDDTFSITLKVKDTKAAAVTGSVLVDSVFDWHGWAQGNLSCVKQVADPTYDFDCTTSVTVTSGSTEGLWVTRVMLMDGPANSNLPWKGPAIYTPYTNSSFGGLGALTNHALSPSVTFTAARGLSSYGFLCVENGEPACDGKEEVRDARMVAIFSEGTTVTAMDSTTGNPANVGLLASTVVNPFTAAQGTTGFDPATAVIAADFGVGKLNLQFSQDVELRFLVPASLEGRTLYLQSLRDGETGWTTETESSVAYCVQPGGSWSEFYGTRCWVKFHVDHATTFAVTTALPGGDGPQVPNPVVTTPTTTAPGRGVSAHTGDTDSPLTAVNLGVLAIVLGVVIAGTRRQRS